ncbi:hypothetical protein KQX54_006387 [Cotesia glomerata]|uniref:Uncharacterized protein n=1 Tax=Cotesia glomerata TaxID=32391 RepID=A0AAV7J1I0_COTGL|nr:hypothetical protein KQX54_006387 [Cotesia glomerata]
MPKLKRKSSEQRKRENTVCKRRKRDFTDSEDNTDNADGEKGRAVNVPTNVETSVNILPRVKSEAMIIPICFRRKKSFKYNVMFENVRPQAIKKAAMVLRNSEIYKHCNIQLDLERDKNNIPEHNNCEYDSKTDSNNYSNVEVDNLDYNDNNSSDDDSDDEEPVNVEDASTL